MREYSLISGSGYVLTLVAGLMLLLILPAASAASRRLKPAWRAWVWPFMFGGLALAGLAGALATMLGFGESASLVWKLVVGLAGLSFTFLILNALYRAVEDQIARRFAPLIWAVYGLFALAVFALNSFLPLLVYDALSSVLVFLVYSTLYARNRDRASDARSIMIGTGLILAADLVASIEFSLNIGPVSFNQLFLYNLLTVAALVFFYLGASASYSIKYDLQRTRERALTSQ